MEVQGKLKQIDETKTFGKSEFRKRECRVTTNEQYPQILPIEFVQDKCELLDKYKIGDDVTISINLRGSEWTNPKGEVKCFPNIQGWRIEKLDVTDPQPLAPVSDLKPLADSEDDDLPF